MENRSQLIRKLIRTEELSPQEAQSLGDIREADPNLPFKYIIRGDTFLGSRVYSDDEKNIATISSIHGNYVAKLDNDRRDLYKENKNLELAKETDTPLINSHGMTNIYDVKKNSFRSAIILDQIVGETIKKSMKLSSNSRQKEKILAKHDYALKKAREQFTTCDTHYQNAMIEKHTQRTILIDPESWIYIG